MPIEPGTYQLVCTIPKLRLYMGHYTLRVHLKEQAGGREFEVLDGICPFEVVMYGRDREGGWWRGTCTYLEEGSWEVSRVNEKLFGNLQSPAACRDQGTAQNAKHAMQSR